MNKDLNYSHQVFHNQDFLVVPKNSFIACFDVPFLNRHGNRTSHAMVGYNKVNLFKRY
jgi:hypothetical protein